jgi:hypothetical protein
MKSITIHGIEREMEKHIKERAKSARTSINKVVKELLAKALGLGQDKQDHRDEFLDLFGVWTEEDEKKFQAAVQDFEVVHPEDWK